MFKKIKSFLSNEKDEKQTKTIDVNSLKINLLLKFGFYIKKNINNTFFHSFFYNKDSLLEIKSNFFTKDTKILSYLYIMKNFIAISDKKNEIIQKELQSYNINYSMFMEEYKKFLKTLEPYIFKLKEINFESYVILDDEINEIINDLLDNTHIDEELINKYYMKKIIDNYGNTYKMINAENLIKETNYQKLEEIIDKYNAIKLVDENKFVILIKAKDE